MTDRFRLLSLSCAVLVAGIGMVALLGWIFNLPMLSSLGAGMIPVAPSTAVMLVLYSVAAMLRAGYPSSRRTYWAGLLINASGALVALLLLTTSFLGIYPDAEHVGIKIVNAPAETPVGHMSPVTGFCFFIASLSFLASLRSSPARLRWIAASRLLAGLLVLVGFVLALAYLYGTPLLYGSTFIPPAALTGVAFLVLGLALLGLARIQAPLFPLPSDASTRVSFTLILIFFVLASGIVTAGFFYYRNYEKRYRSEVERQLTAIADLKTDELVQWRRERLGDAAIFYKNANFAQRISTYFKSPEDAEAKSRLATWLRQIREAHHYDRVSVYDPRGRERMSFPKTQSPNTVLIHEHVAAVLRVNQAVFEDLYRDGTDQHAYLAVLVPISDAERSRRTIGVLALRIDPEQYLFPFLKRWPTPSRTAETLLVRREGNDVLFLNDLKFRKNAALYLRSPLDREDMPAVQAVLGRQGIVEGRDYRNIPVIADVRAVPDSPWFLVARMDTSEVYAPVRERLWVLIALVMALLIGAGAGVSLVWRQQRADFYRERYLTSEALRSSEERFRLLIEGVRDYAVVMLDLAGHVMSWNSGAERIKGYPEDEIIGKHFSIFYPDEDVRQGKPQRELQRAADSGRFEDEGWRVRKDGSRFWANVILTALRDQEGGLRGFSKITRDITEQRRTQQERETTIEFLRLVNRSKGTKDLVQAAATFFQQQSGCEAVGIRLHEGEDYPYFEARGFPKEFVLMENSLCARDSANCVIRDSSGNPVIECMCGNVICGRFNPAKPFFTEHGSFWSNNTTELLRRTTEADRQARTRNRCNGEGYESVALLPLRLGEQRLGLLQLNDRRIGVFSAEAISSWERLADYLAVALLKFQTEEALRQSEARFATVFRSSPIGIVLSRPHDGVFLDVNDSFLRVYGYTREELIGRSSLEMNMWVDPEDRARMVMALREKGRVQNLEARFRKKSGEIGDLFISAELIQLGSEQCMLGMFSDITDRKKAEEAVERNRSALLEAQKLAKIGNWEWDITADLHTWSEEIFSIYGRDPELPPADIQEVPKYFTPESWKRLSAAVEKGMTSGTPYECDAEVVRPDGVHRWVTARGEAERDVHGAVILLRGTVQDITERKRAEEEIRTLNAELEQRVRDRTAQLEAANKELEAFSYSVSHDLRAPLRHMSGFVELLNKRTLTLDEKSRHYLDVISNAALHMGKLVDDLLAFSRMGRTEMMRTRVGLRALFDEAVKDLHEDLKGRTVQWVVKDLPEVVCDPAMLKLVFVNLLSNSLKFTRTQTQTVIEVGYSASAPDGETIVYVKDNGVGFDIKYADKLFNLFQRLHRPEEFEGTGVGLANVRRIIHRHGGRTWAEGSVGGGASIYFSLPRTKEENA